MDLDIHAMPYLIGSRFSPFNFHDLVDQQESQKKCHADHEYHESDLNDQKQLINWLVVWNIFYFSIYWE